MVDFQDDPDKWDQDDEWLKVSSSFTKGYNLICWGRKACKLCLKLHKVSPQTST